MHMHKIIIIQGQYSSHQAYTHKKGGEKHTLTMQENKKKEKKREELWLHFGRHISIPIERLASETTLIREIMFF